jgi:hypothetical protein
MTAGSIEISLVRYMDGLRIKVYVSGLLPR